jgi:uroporphyrinogen-III synthase
VIRVPVYRWILPDDVVGAQRLIEATIGGRLHAVTFTSAPAVRNFFAIAGRMGRADELRDALASKVRVACVGPVCAEQAIDDGIPDPIVPSKARLGLLVRALCDRLSADVERVRGAVRVQGTRPVDGEQVDPASARPTCGLRESAPRRRRQAPLPPEVGRQRGSACRRGHDHGSAAGSLLRHDYPRDPRRGHLLDR